MRARLPGRADRRRSARLAQRQPQGHRQHPADHRGRRRVQPGAQDSGIGDAVQSAASSLHINALVLGWLLALLLSLSTGSATVGIVAATGMLAPIAASDGSLESALLVVAIGAGSIGLNYVNHAGFWMVKESFGMTLGEATKSHTAIQTIVSVCGLVMVLLISAVT
ncbi:hypothetical protein NKH77_49410 [Streptomyces sp. M19]